MLKPTTGRIVRHDYQLRLMPLYAANLILIFVSVMTSFVNAVFLSEFMTDAQVGLVYAAGSGFGLIVFLFVSRVLKKIGNYHLMFLFLVINAVSLAIMPHATNAVQAICLFLLHFITLPILFYSIDIFLEAALDNNESSTGTKRGLLLTLIGLVAAVAPLVMSIAIPDSGSFVYVYTLAAIAILPVLAIIRINLKQFSDPGYGELDIFAAIRSFWIQQDIRNVYLASLTLNMFFAFTVVYLPLYLIGEVGLSWDELGIMLSIGILAYLIFEYPVGYVADNYTGEKEFMALGFTILIITTASVAFMTTSNFVYWTMLMFIMRIGASIVEVTTESYFFKKTKSSDAQIISFFRTTRPASYIIVTLVGGLALLYIPFNLLFVVTAAIFIPALFFTMYLHDTK